MYQHVVPCRREDCLWVKRLHYRLSPLFSNIRILVIATHRVRYRVVYQRHRRRWLMSPGSLTRSLKHAWEVALWRITIHPSRTEVHASIHLPWQAHMSRCARGGDRPQLLMHGLATGRGRADWRQVIDSWNHAGNSVWTILVWFEVVSV